MTTRVKGSILIGVALVSAAFVLSQYRVTSAPTAATNNLVPPSLATGPTLREYVPPTDSDGDGIPDWQQLLDRTEPLEVSQGTSTFREPDTLTEQFALDFFQTYMRDRSFGNFGTTPDELIAEASDELIAQAQDTLRTRNDIRIIQSSPEALRTHANEVALTLTRASLPEGTRNELEIVEDAVARNDANVLAELNPILQNYSLVITELELLLVPETMVKEHLDFLNATIAIRNDIAAFRFLYSDPMMGLLRLRRYQDDLQGLIVSYDNLFKASREQGAVFQPNDPVYTVYEFTE